MNELVFKSEKGTPVTNSLLVAQKFGKEHKHVIEAIRSLSADLSADLKMFYETTYIDSFNREQPVFVMNKDGFTLLVMGFKGKKALQFKLEYIKAFNQMEEVIKTGFIAPKTIKEALQLALQQAERIEEQERQLQLQAPKVKYTNEVLQSATTYTMTQIAKELDLTSAVVLEKKLEQLGIIFRQSGQWFPYAKYSGQGYCKNRTHPFTRSDGTTGTNSILVWTETGRMFLHDKLTKN